MNLTLKVWRQRGPSDAGHFEAYDAPGITEDMSFIEMLDVVNEQLIHSGREAIAFDHELTRLEQTVNRLRSKQERSECACECEHARVACAERVVLAGRDPGAPRLPEIQNPGPAVCTVNPKADRAPNGLGARAELTKELAQVPDHLERRDCF